MTEQPMIIIVNSLGQDIKQARLAAGYSQEGLGRRVFPDISLDAAKMRIGRIEKGYDIPTPEDLLIIRHYLELNLEMSEINLRTRKRLDQSRPPTPYPCKACGEMFQARNRRQKYCTPECRKKHWWNTQGGTERFMAERRAGKKIVYERPGEDDVLHAAHLRQMPPEKLSRMLDDVLSGRRSYVKGHR